MNQRLLLLTLMVTSWAACAGEDDFSFEDPFGEEEIAIPLGTIWEIDFTRKFQLDVFNVSEDNFKFGQYNGLNEQGSYLAASWDVISRAGREDNEDTGYWTLSADNLGLRTSDLSFSMGKQGNYGFSIDLSSLRTVDNDTGVTPFHGDEVLRLPESWIPALTTAGMTSFTTFNQFEPELDRYKLKLAFNKHLTRNWSLDTAYSYERKDGEKSTSAAFYIDAANPHAANLAEPVDYSTTEIDLTTEYSGQKLQFALSYHFSNFDNDNSSLSWQNPYAGVFEVAVDYPNGFGTMALPADHKFQQLRARGTLLVTPKIRVQFDGTIGITEHEDSLLPYTSNPALTLHTALPVSSLDDLDTSTFYLAILTNPISRLALNFKYRYEERDNTMDRYPWIYVRGDSQDQPLAIRAVFNNPQNIIREEFTSEATWRFPNRTRLTLIYDYKEVTRSLVSVEETEEDRLTGIVKFYPMDRLAIRLEGAYSDRSASTYQWAESFLNSFTIDQINRIPDNRRWSNHPLLRQNYLANRESSFIELKVTYQPSEFLSLMFDGDYQYHDYDETVLGLKSDSQTTANLSANYTSSDKVNIYGWVNYGLYETEQTGRSFRGGIEQPANDIFPPLTQGSDRTRDWDVEVEAELFGFGAGLTWVVLQDKFDISADYVYTKTTTEHEFGTHGAADILGLPLPDQDSLLHQFTLNANYHVRPNFTWSLRYDYYRFSDDNWNLDNVDPNTLDKVLGFGQRNPNEVVNMISVAMTYRY